MGVGEKGALRCQSIDVWSLGVRVSAQAADPVVLIIDGDEEDIGLLSCEN